MAAEEIYGYRDWELSQRHRNWGYDCPMMDMDMVVWEFESRKVKGICEYKFWRVDRNGLETSLAADVLRDAAGDRYPAWITVYDRGRWVFRVVPCNELASEFFGKKRLHTERQYVEALYGLRGMTAPPSVLAACRDSIYDPFDEEEELVGGDKPGVTSQPPAEVTSAEVNSSPAISQQA